MTPAVGSRSQDRYILFFASLDENAERLGVLSSVREAPGHRFEQDAIGLDDRQWATLVGTARDCNRALAEQGAKSGSIVDTHLALLKKRLGTEAFARLVGFMTYAYSRANASTPLMEQPRPGGVAMPERAIPQAAMPAFSAKAMPATAPLPRQAPYVPSPAIPRRDQTIAFHEVSHKVYRDGDFTPSAYASSGLRVTFTAVGDCSAFGSTVHILSAGKCWVTAHQPGNERFNPAPDVEQRIPIEKAAQSMGGLSIAPKTYLDPDFLLDTTASSGLPVVLVASGDCELTDARLHITGAGSCAITAHQPGDSNFTAARILADEFPIAKADQTIAFPEFLDPLDIPSFPNVVPDLPLNVKASSGLPVTLLGVGWCVVDGPLLHILGAGMCSVIAEQPGDRNFNPAPTVVRSFEIVGPPPPPLAPLTPY